MATPSCPEPARLKDLLDGTLPEPEQSALSAHLEACAACQQTVEGLAAGRDTWAGAGRLADAGHAPPAAALQKALDEVRDAPEVTQTHVGSASAAELPADFLAPPDDPGHLGKLDHFEAVAQRRLNRVQPIGRGEKKHARQIERHVQIMIGECIVLRRIQNFQQR